MISREAFEEDVRELVPALRYFDEVDSTNRVAQEWTDAEDFSVVAAGHQTAGRGRFSRTWYDEPGTSLLFSMVLRPKFPPRQFGLINLTAAYSMSGAVEVVSDESFHPRVKWPNDIVWRNHKVGGILSSSHEGPEGPVVVLGVGVNIATEHFPKEISEQAMSILKKSLRPFTQLELLESFLRRFHRAWINFPEETLRWYPRICETIGKQVSVEMGAETIEGTATGIDELGRLVLDGKRAISSGEIVKVREKTGPGS